MAAVLITEVAAPAQTCADCRYREVADDGYSTCRLWATASAARSRVADTIEAWVVRVQEGSGWGSDGLPVDDAPPCPMWEDVGHG